MARLGPKRTGRVSPLCRGTSDLNFPSNLLRRHYCSLNSHRTGHIVLTLVISLSMIVRQIVVHRPPQGSFARGKIFDRQSALTERTHRPAWAFKFGLRAGRGKVSM